MFALARFLILGAADIGDNLLAQGVGWGNHLEVSPGHLVNLNFVGLLRVKAVNRRRVGA